MSMFLPARAEANRFELPAGPPALLLRLRHVLGRRRWRRAPPFEHLNDHLRRDIGLPPLDPASPGRCRR